MASVISPPMTLSILNHCVLFQNQYFTETLYAMHLYRLYQSETLSSLLYYEHLLLQNINEMHTHEQFSNIFMEFKQLTTVQCWYFTATSKCECTKIILISLNAQYLSQPQFFNLHLHVCIKSVDTLCTCILFVCVDSVTF